MPQPRDASQRTSPQPIIVCCHLSSKIHHSQSPAPLKLDSVPATCRTLCRAINVDTSFSNKMEKARAKLTMGNRVFEEIGVGNFVAQRRADRFPSPEPRNPPPRSAHWRSNLSALSQKHNLYFAASTDKIHITVPRDLRQTLPGTPDLVLNLPRTPAGISLGGYIDESIPHCVNHIKVGNLGLFEVLLIACDDGDVLAYYTHNFLDELKRQNSHAKAPLSCATPFFHEHVESSVWGLALHQQSRLIAVSTNLRRITIFAHGCTASRRRESDPEERIREDIQAGVRSLQKFKSFNGHNIVRARDQNYKMTLPLGEQGHNIPCIDFVSGSGGDASHILASDINGNLWIFDLVKGTKECKPRVHTALDRENVMGWGVLCLPLQYFKVVKTPHEGLGLPHLHDSFRESTRPREMQCFDITSTLPDLRENSPWHPIFGYGINGATTTPKADQDVRNLSIPSFKYDEFRVNFPESPEHSALSRRKQSLDSSEAAAEIRTLNFLLSLPPSERPYTWDEIEQDQYKSRKSVSLDSSPDSFDSTQPKRPAQRAQPQAGQDKIDVNIPCGHAIIRTFNQDIELLPPDYPSTLRTFCRGVVEQRLGDLRDQLRHFDRLNMLSVIPELSLVVAASQIGRAALITLTRLGDEISYTSLTMPVVMFRLDLILPLKMHEDEYKPWVPLAGMAIAPLQASAAKSWAGQRWRLLLHYVDQTILSYELYRNEEGGLVVL